MEKNNNNAIIAGTVSTVPTTYECCGEKFLSFTLNVKRTSGTEDKIPVNVSEYLAASVSLGDELGISGQIRTYNKEENGKNRLVIVFFAQELIPYDGDKNEVNVSGFFCKTPVHRVTPLGRDICDVMIAVNRLRGKSDYIPCVVWGRTARHIAELEIGSEVSVIGRLQSRDYTKTDKDGTVSLRTAYEVSVNRISSAEAKA